MADTAVLTQGQMIWMAVVRLLRTGIAAGLPVLITYLAGHTDVRFALLGPVINAVAKYLRDAFKWDWLPV